ncbi:MAG: squalene--hopene cyclase [Acidobacteria bacterium]|nr:squalene--hopene cyclase [Acidobacteriota bacterium]
MALPVPFETVTLDQSLAALRGRLLSARVPAGYWVGELSSGALSTATAISALALVDRHVYEPQIRKGLAWLARSCNPDGGWGDTVFSLSNISTTALCWAAFGLAGDTSAAFGEVLQRAERWLSQNAGGLEPESIGTAIIQCYGADRTFSVPILTNCALAGRLGPGTEAWRVVRPLPFELAALPQRWYHWLRLPVVSYALPALIAIGQVRHHHLPSANPLIRWLRKLAQPRTLEILQRIQPASGGFLEAIPLTSFVVMSLAAAGHRHHPVVSRGIAFLVGSVRPDGSWPIDTNLSTWVTTLSVNALAANPCFCQLLAEPERRRISEWLLGQQFRQEHPYTLAEPGGWAWTNLSGGVPDADDTSGALLALRNLGFKDGRVAEAVTAGVRWLVNLQNRDGGVPTFCKGWGTLPFDRSSPDITAHALRGLSAWLAELRPELSARAAHCVERGIAYLARVQEKDGSWIPLWFGNQFAPNHANPTYGTSRVLKALQALARPSFSQVSSVLEKGLGWLLSAQNVDGGWGGAPGVSSSIEETSLAIEALAGTTGLSSHRAVEPALSKGVAWLIQQTQQDPNLRASPIGLYFAKLWYFEQLYPLIFTVAAMESARTVCDRAGFKRLNKDRD